MESLAWLSDSPTVIRRAMYPNRTAPAVWLEEGPVMRGPIMSNTEKFSIQDPLCLYGDYTAVRDRIQVHLKRIALRTKNPFTFYI